MVSRIVNVYSVNLVNYLENLDDHETSLYAAMPLPLSVKSKIILSSNLNMNWPLTILWQMLKLFLNTLQKPAKKTDVII